MIFSRLTIRHYVYFSAFSSPIILGISVLLFFPRLLSDIATRAIPADLLGYLLSLTLLKYAPHLLMLSAFSGVFLTMRRFFQQNEMSAWASAGLGLHNFIPAVLIFIFPVTILISLFSFFFSPWAVENMYITQSKAVFAITPQQLARDKFIVLPGGTHVLFWKNEGDIVLASNNDHKKHEVIFAKNIKRNTDGEFLLSQGNAYYFDESQENPFLETLFFNEIKLSLPQTESIHIPPRGKALSSLSWQNAKDRAELIWRINIPILSVILTLSALFLSRGHTYYSRRYIYLSALAVFFIALNILNYIKTLLETNIISIPLALIIPPVAIGAIVYAFYRLIQYR